MSDRTPPITLAADRVQRTRPDSIARVDALDIGHDFIDDGWCPPDEAAALRARLAELEAQQRPRIVESPEELDRLPGRSIVIGNNTPWPEAWQLTSHSVFPRAGANWGSPCQYGEDRITSQELLARVGSVTLLHTPAAEEENRG